MNEPTNAQPTAPAAPATPAAPSTPESYDANGRVEVKDDVFLTEDEVGGKPAAPTPPSDNTPATPAQPAQPATPENNGEETPTTETGKAAVGEPTLLAGKYNNEAELDSGLTGLGLTPSDYKDTASKEAAYKAGQAAMTRVSQQVSERERAEREAAEAAANNPAPAADPTELAQKIIGSLDMTKINNVGELVQQLVPALVANMPTAQTMSPEQIAQQIQPKIQEREERIKALAGLETEIPRLAMKVDEATGKQVPVDPAFRKAFAVHLMGGQYPRTAAGLKAAMTDFLSLGKSIAEAQGATYQQNAADKGSAAQPAGAGQPAATVPGKATPEDDILGGIMGAYEAHNHKVNPV